VINVWEGGGMGWRD